MNEEDPKIQKIKDLMEFIGEGFISKKEFENAFLEIMKLFLKREEMITKTIEMMRQTFDAALAKVHGDHAANYADLRGKVNDLFVSDQLERMSGENKTSMAELKKSLNSIIDKKLNEVDTKISKVKDGYTPIKGKDYFDGMPGVPGKDISPTIVKELKEEIEKIKKLPRGRLGMRKVPIIKRYRLTDQVNGSTRAFTLPQDTVDVLGLWGTQFPITFDTNDWTFTGNTLTLASSITTPQSGQTLMAIIETLFYG